MARWDGCFREITCFSWDGCFREIRETGGDAVIQERNDEGLNEDKVSGSSWRE